MQNLVSAETPAECDRLHLVLTGTPARSPLKCLLYNTEAVDNNTHMKTCPATAQHRMLHFLRMAEVMASTGDSLHHDPSQRPSASAPRNVDVKHLLSGVHVAPFHKGTPICALPQNTIPGTGHKPMMSSAAAARRKRPDRRASQPTDLSRTPPSSVRRAAIRLIALL